MTKDKKQTSFFLRKYFAPDKIVAFGTVFFVTSVILLIGMVLFPSVRFALHGSSFAADAISAGRTDGNKDGLTSVIFNDVDSNHPNAQAIAFLKDRHILSAHPDGNFQPENIVTRAELLKFLFDAQQVDPSTAVYRACFKDVTDEWFAPYVCYGKAKGLVQGYSDGTFGPGNNVSVIEGVKILLQAYLVPLSTQAPVADMKFDDQSWYTHYLWTAFDKKLVTWESLVESSPLPNLTKENLTHVMLKRSQLAEMLYRFMK